MTRESQQHSQVMGVDRGEVALPTRGAAMRECVWALALSSSSLFPCNTLQTLTEYSKIS